MIARGDLAVELGWARLAEMQEEILWLAESARVPVIWATQVFGQLIRENQPTRAEMTDAAMSQRAECVMLNTGPFVLDAITLLDDIAGRMQGHQLKKAPACGHCIGSHEVTETRKRTMANAVKTIAKYIRNNPGSSGEEILRGLCAALESQEAFEIHRIYELDKKAFELALDLLEEWRFDRHVVERRLQKYMEQKDDKS